MALNINVRWADNTETLRRNLQSGLDQIEATRAGADKMVKALSGDNLVIAAHKYAAAIKEIGGVERLNASEKERINTLVTKAIEKYELFGKVAPQALHDLANATKQAAEPTESLNLSFGKLVGSFVTAQAIIGAVKGAFNAVTGEIAASVKAASDAEKATVQLVAALKAQGTATPSVVTAIQGYASALQKTTIYQDDALEGAAALLVTVGNVMPRDMEKALKAVTDLASGLGVDLHTATLQVAKAAEGNTSALKKAGIQIDETKAKAEGFGYVLDEIEKKFSGQAAAIAGTYQGRLEQLGNTWNNVEESIGRVITQNATVLKAFDLLNQSIDTETGELKDNQAITNLVSDAVILAVKSVGLLAQAIDTTQTILAGFVIGLRSGAIALGNIGVAALESARALELMQGNFVAAKGTGVAITALKGALKELDDRNVATTQHSIKFGDALQGISRKADDLAKELDATRGKTIALTTATDKNKGAWDQHTKAVGKNVETVDKSKEAHERLVQKVRELEIVMPGLRHSVGELDSTEQKAIETHLAHIAAAEKLDEELKKLHDTIRAIERTDFKFDLSGLEKVGLKVPILSEAQKKIVEAKDATNQWGKALDDLSETFTQLATIAGPKFTEIARAIGVTVVSVKQLQSSIAAAAKEQEDFGKVSFATNASVAFSWIQLGITVISYLQKFYKAQQDADHARQLAMQDLTRGQSFGSDAPFSDSLNARIREQAEALRKLGIQYNLTAAEALNLSAIINELGGFGNLNAASLLRVQQLINGIDATPFTPRVEGLFDVIAKGGTVGAEALKTLDDVLSDMATHLTKNGGLVDKFFLDMLAKARATGKELAQLSAFITQQVQTNIIGGLSAFTSGSAKATADLEDVRKKMAEIKAERDDLIRRGTLGVSDTARLAELNKQWDELTKKEQASQAFAITSQNAATALGATVAVSFAEMIKAGTPILDIFKTLDPIIDQLQKQFEAAGFTGGLAFDKIREMAALAKDEVAGPVIQGIIGLGQALSGLHNIGALDQDTFEGLTEQISSMYDSLVKQGKGGPAALRLLQAPLQTVWRLVHDFGYEVDDNTRALLEQAEAQGIVGDKMRPINEQMLEATNKIADAVEYLAEVFGYLPKAAKDAADGISDNLSKIKIPTVKIKYEWDTEPGGAPPYIPSPRDPLPFPGTSAVTPDEWRTATAQRGSTAVSVRISPTIYLTSDDVKDPDRLVAAWDQAMRLDTGLMRTKIERIAQKAAEDAVV